MAALGSVVAPPTAATGLSGGLIWNSGLPSFLLGNVIAIFGDDGSNLPGTDTPAPTTPTTGQIWPRGNP